MLFENSGIYSFTKNFNNLKIKIKSTVPIDLQLELFSYFLPVVELETYTPTPINRSIEEVEAPLLHIRSDG